MTLPRLVLLAAACLFGAACSGSSTAPAAVASVSVTAAETSVVAGGTIQLTAVPRDAAGNALAGRTVTWSSLNDAVGSVNENGLFSSTGAGSVIITARVESKTGSLTLSVLPPPIATLSIVGDTLLEAGRTRQFTAVARDAGGAVLDNRVATWTSTDTTIVRITATGSMAAVANAIALGTARLVATSEGRADTLRVTVVPPFAPPPSITAISPATLVPGTAATLTGTGFHGTAALNTVTFSGSPAAVLGASPTQLTVRVPCVPSGNVSIRVTSDGLTGPATAHPLAVNTIALDVGRAHVAPSAEASACNELPAGADVQYLVAIFNASAALGTVSDFRLAGNTPPTAQAAVPMIAATRPRTRPQVRDEHTTRDSIHFAWLERERALYRQLRGRLPLVEQAPPPAMAQPPALGTERRLFWNRTSCSDSSTTMNVRAIYVGPRSIIWEDVENSLQSAAHAELAGYYQRLGVIFDQEQYEVVRDNFGDPLLRDPQTDNDGRIHMVFTQRLNNSGAAAYVTGCDQFPRNLAPASNFGEFFYGFVPTLTGSNLNSTSYPDGWFNFMARTVVHEVKHIASFAARIHGGAPGYEESWLEEGTARHAEEVWVRAHLHRVPWKGNTGFGSAATNGVYCDFLPADAACYAADPLRRPGYGMRRHFNEILPKFVEPWDYSPYGAAPGQTGAVFYQTAWSLVRYAIDRWGTSDADFLSALNRSHSSGLANLTSVAGVPVHQLLGLWGLTLYADDLPMTAQPSADLQFPTWNTRDIYRALNQDPTWSQRFTSEFMLQPLQLPFGSFSTDRPGLRGGAHAYYLLTGTASTPQLLRLLAIDGGTAPGTLHIAVARLR